MFTKFSRLQGFVFSTKTNLFAWQQAQERQEESEQEESRQELKTVYIYNIYIYMYAYFF